MQINTRDSLNPKPVLRIISKSRQVPGFEKPWNTGKSLLKIQKNMLKNIPGASQNFMTNVLFYLMWVQAALGAFQEGIANNDVWAIKIFQKYGHGCHVCYKLKMILLGIHYFNLSSTNHEEKTGKNSIFAVKICLQTQVTIICL